MHNSLEAGTDRMDGGLRKLLESTGVFPDETQIERLELFIRLLSEWNSVHNLTGARKREGIVENILDSLAPTTFVERPDTLLDVGTGAGFPGLILAICWKGTETVLCEPLQKRAAFLRYAVLELGLKHVRIERKRVEELEEGPFELISSRAVTDISLLLKLTRKAGGENSAYLLYKGSRLENELKKTNLSHLAEIVERGYRKYLYLRPRDNIS